MSSNGSPKVCLTDITISDGTRIEIPKFGVVLLVGPNNAGKSQSLRDIQGIAKDTVQYYTPRSVVAHTIEKNTNLDIVSWAEQNVPSVAADGDATRYYVRGWSHVGIQDIASNWSQPHLAALTGLFILLANGVERLSIGGSESAIDFTKEPPTGPIQRAYLNPDLEKEFGQHCKQAFGLDIVIDRYAGSVITMRVGEPPEFQHDRGRPRKEYIDQLHQLPRLEDQGDGIRSYMGLILSIVAGTQDIILIDEPEAFLHPPQARLLARTLAQRATQHQQVFLATHSADIVQGALEAECPATIIRLTRDGNVNRAAVLKENDVKDLWSDPLLRYSNVLEGLFHDAVVLCESDSDCRYYQAVSDSIAPEQGPDKSESSDAGLQLLFTHCSGKARLSSVLDALKAVQVPVVVVTDFDFLKEKGDVEKLVDSAGGTFKGDIEDNLTVLQSSLKSSKPLRKTTLKDAFIAAVDEADDEILTEKDAENLRAIVRAESGWDKAKRAGKSAVPQGEAYSACENLLSALSDLGILVVPVGELEGFERTIAGHGRVWVAEVLAQGRHKSPGAEASEFVRSIRAVSMRLAGLA